MSRITRYGALITIGSLLMLSGCVIADGSFKYVVVTSEVETVDLDGIESVEFILGSEDLAVTTVETRMAAFTIEKTLRANDKEAGKELLEEAEILFERSGDKLVVKRKKDRSIGISRITKGYVSIDIDVGLPAGLKLKINTGSGDVEVGDRDAMLVIDTGSGDVQTGVAGSGLDLSTGSGDVEVDTARHNVKMRTGSGDVSVGGLGGNAMIGTGSGDITVRKVAGDLSAKAGSGDVLVNNSMGSVTASTGSGDVEILHHTGSADLNTSSGDVELGLDGGEGKIDIDTSSGSVDIIMYGGDAYEVDISTSSGSISSQVPLTVRDASRRRLSGRYGSGGFSLSVSTSSGSVSLLKGAI